MQKILLICLLAALAAPAFAQKQREPNSGTTILNMSERADSEDCADHMRMFTDRFDETVRAEEVKTLPNQPLKITASQNGGIHVRNWDSPEYSIKICKIVAANSKEEAQRVLSQIALEAQAGSVNVKGPEPSDDYSWSTLIMVKAPRNSNLDLSAHNGGISLRGIVSTVHAETVNGGIAVANSNGSLNLEARNGGISIKDSNGDIHANVQNGGLAVKLSEDWKGKGLDAHTQNGGLVVEVPKNFHSSMELASSQYTTILCKGSVCDNAQKTWDDNRKILKFGNASPTLRLSTVNGGVVVKQRDRSEAEL